MVLLTPEAFLTLRAVGAQFHASREGVSAVQEALDMLAAPPPMDGTVAVAAADLRRDAIRLDAGATPTGSDAPCATPPLEIRPGEHLVVLGPSGAGKSSPSRC